jgi:DNA-binding transcriptional LysR family regulator
MDFNHLRTFIAVSRHGHLTRAAESLHLSQPAVSGQIRALEESVGLSLFVRSPTGMTLTPLGRVLLKEAERAVGALHEFQRVAKRLRGEVAGKLTLGTVLEPTVLRVGELLARALERHPRLEIELHHVVSHEALAEVRNGSLDASFYFGKRPAPDLVSIPLRDITYRVCVPVAWSTELASAPWDALAARPWIAAPEASSHRQLVLEVFASRTPLPERLIEADNESVIANLIESAVGISVLRDETAQPLLQEGRIAVWPGASIATRLWLTRAAERRGDPLIDALLGLLGEVWDLRAAANGSRNPGDLDGAAANDPDGEEARRAAASGVKRQ